jgi:uncharacterized protein (TIGR00299 family) protein
MTAHEETGVNQGTTHRHPHPHPLDDAEDRVHAVHAHSKSSQIDDILPSLSPTGGLKEVDGGQIAYFDCFAGVSGDMLLGALVDAGLSLDALEAELAKLDLDGYEIDCARIQSHGLTGTRLSVRDTLGAYPARHLHDIQQMIEGSTLSDTVKVRSLNVLERLGRAEATIHGVPLQEVHFHEIGAVDTIVDIVGFVAGLELLGIGQAYASAIPLGSGTIQTAHGRLPVPAPATLALLSSVGAPTVAHPAQTEIVTPTGAALLSGLAVFERPQLQVHAIGYGFGQKEFAWANGLRVWIGQRWPGERGTAGALDAFEQDQVVVLECNLDDSTGEMLGYAMERLFAAGALDAWFTSIQMKKNRPGVLLSVLSPAEKTMDLASVLLRETTTLGVRLSSTRRFKADRRMRAVHTPWGEVQVKEKWLGGLRLDSSPEYADCARLARATGEPLHRVMNAARCAAAAERVD